MRPDIARYGRARGHEAATAYGFTRRSFLERSAGTAAFVLAFRLGGEAAAQSETETTKEKKPPNPFDAWVRIAKDGTATLVLAKSEMGQGAMTALPMILADELDLDWAKVRVEQAPTNPAIYDHGTGGSGSIKDSWLPLRQAGAAARAMLVAAAAEQWKVDPAACKTAKGVVTGPGGRSLSYGDLVEEAAKRPLPDFKTLALKKDADLTIVGTNVPRVDVPAKTDGRARFGIDVRVPGMLYAVIARCPTIGGKAVRFDAAKAKAVPGVKHVVEIPPTGPHGAFAPGGVAVVAETSWAAIQGRLALGVEWDHGLHVAESSAALRQQMEQLIAQPGKVCRSDFEAEAAQVSKAVGAPVQVLWTREDDIQHGFFRPMALHRLAAALDEKGRPLAWHHRMSSTSIDAFWTPPDKAKPESSEIGGAVNLPYAIPNLRMEYAPARSAVPVMWWRSVEHSITAFVNESFLDELAHLAGVDPLKFRLDLLAEPRQVKFPAADGPVLDTRRLKGVLELAAAKAGWGRPLPQGRARGIACHFSFDSYAAEVAEVSVAKAGIRVHRVVAAVDIGRAIFPDAVAAQVEGAVAYGLSAALKGAITIKDGRCEQSNFHDFEVLRMPEMPVVEVHIVPSTEAPTGIGEPGLPPVAPAVMNAVFAATGKRLRRLPVRAPDLA